MIRKKKGRDSKWMEIQKGSNFKWMETQRDAHSITGQPVETQHADLSIVTLYANLTACTENVTKEANVKEDILQESPIDGGMTPVT